MQKEDGSAIPLSSASDIVRSISRMQKPRLDVLVLCEGKNVKKVAEKAAKLL
jgi:hypothetical protein